MMKKLTLLILLLIIHGVQAQSTSETYKQFIEAEGIVTYYVKNDNVPIRTEVNLFVYSVDDQAVLVVLDGKVVEYAAKLSRTYTEQDLLIKEYIPTKHLDTSVKRIFKFAYDPKSMEPIVVVEIAYTSNNYQVTKYFTKKWAELTNYQD